MNSKLKKGRWQRKLVFNSTCQSIMTINISIHQLTQGFKWLYNIIHWLESSDIEKDLTIQFNDFLLVINTWNIEKMYIIISCILSLYFYVPLFTILELGLLLIKRATRNTYRPASTSCARRTTYVMSYILSNLTKVNSFIINIKLNIKLIRIFLVLPCSASCHEMYHRISDLLLLVNQCESSLQV